MERWGRKGKGGRRSESIDSLEGLELVLVLTKYIGNIIISQGLGVLFGYCLGIIK